jgi:hypothetical protein
MTTDFGTTWYELDLAETCTQYGQSAVPALSVPGCMVPGGEVGPILLPPDPF